MDPPGVDARRQFDEWVARGERCFPGLLGIEAVTFEQRRMVLELPITASHLAPNGYLHGGAVTALADTACGYGCRMSLPDGASGFTTVELKANFLGTTTEGTVRCDARLVHGGRSTQVWDATVSGPDETTLALFRATQLILYASAR